MALSLRYRIVLTLLPLLALLAALGSAAVVLLYRLGGSIDLILRENYDSVIAMERLNEALERIDSSFQFALAGEEKKDQYEANWALYEQALRTEQDNITLPGEAELVDQLVRLTAQYRREGEQFYAAPAAGNRRHRLYFAEGGRPGPLLRSFEQIKKVSADILLLNQQNMKDASLESRRLANRSLWWFGTGLLGVVALAAILAVHTMRTVLRPIRAVTQSALAIGAGNLDQVVPVTSDDELGRLADAFNVMGRQLRHYRQSDYARLLRAQQTSQATIDSFPDPVLVVDAEGHVEMANPAARRLLGVAPAAPDQARIPWQPPEPLRQPVTDALLQQRPFLPEGFDHAVPLRSDGKDCFFLPRVLPIRDPYANTLGAAVLLQDVTRFQLLDQVKNNLVATVSHELKTPLTSIRLAVHLLLEEAVGPLTPKQTELLLDGRDNAERLLATINNLLDLTRLERGPEGLDTRPESPATLLAAAADKVRPQAETRGVEVRLEAPPDLPPVRVDAERFGHALDNLLDNAVAHTPRGGHITLSAAAAADGHVVLEVADTGAGIPPEHLPHVFERFFRIPGQERTGGTGLGLAIVREIVTAHAGTVTCASQPGQGAVFRISLPAGG